MCDWNACAGKLNVRVFCMRAWFILTRARSPVAAVTWSPDGIIHLDTAARSQCASIKKVCRIDTCPIISVMQTKRCHALAVNGWTWRWCIILIDCWYDWLDGGGGVV